MRRSVIIVAILSISLSSSCGCPAEDPQPIRPDHSEGWKDTYESGVHFLGEFVLNSGESTSNRRIGVKVVEIKPAKPCTSKESALGYPEATIRFFNGANGQVLCERSFMPGNALLYASCGTDFSLTAIGIIAINSKDGWVHFDLRE